MKRLLKRIIYGRAWSRPSDHFFQDYRWKAWEQAHSLEIPEGGCVPAGGKCINCLHQYLKPGGLLGCDYSVPSEERAELKRGGFVRNIPGVGGKLDPPDVHYGGFVERGTSRTPYLDPAKEYIQGALTCDVCDSDNLKEMQAQLGEEYQHKAFWFMSKDVYELLLRQTGAQGHFVVQQPNNTAGSGNTIFGKTLILLEGDHQLFYGTLALLYDHPDLKLLEPKTRIGTTIELKIKNGSEWKTIGEWTEEQLSKGTWGFSNILHYMPERCRMLPITGLKGICNECIQKCRVYYIFQHPEKLSPANPDVKVVFSTWPLNEQVNADIILDKKQRLRRLLDWRDPVTGRGKQLFTVWDEEGYSGRGLGYKDAEKFLFKHLDDVIDLLGKPEERAFGNIHTSRRKAYPQPDPNKSWVIEYHGGAEEIEGDEAAQWNEKLIRAASLRCGALGVPFGVGGD